MERVLPDGTYDVLYEDGYVENKVRWENIRVVDVGAAARASGDGRVPDAEAQQASAEVRSEETESVPPGWAKPKESAKRVRNLVKGEQVTLDLDVVREALETDPVKDQADHGRVGGMLAGTLFRVCGAVGPWHDTTPV